MKIKTDQFIILRLSPNEQNIAFICETFELTQCIFFDHRLPTSQLVKENPEEINFEYYEKFLEKCMKIEETEITFTMNEFFYLAQTIDFVAKCFIGGTIDDLEKIIASNPVNEGSNFVEFKKWYWTKSSDFFQDFRECFKKNEKLLKRFNDELNYKNEKLLNLFNDELNYENEI
jgi:hypothetical protein